MKYTVTRTHTETYIDEIEAGSPEEAEVIARKLDPEEFDLLESGEYEFKAVPADLQESQEPETNGYFLVKREDIAKELKKGIDEAISGEDGLSYVDVYNNHGKPEGHSFVTMGIDIHKCDDKPDMAYIDLCLVADMEIMYLLTVPYIPKNVTAQELEKKLWLIFDITTGLCRRSERNPRYFYEPTPYMPFRKECDYKDIEKEIYGD